MGQPWYDSDDLARMPSPEKDHSGANFDAEYYNGVSRTRDADRHCLPLSSQAVGETVFRKLMGPDASLPTNQNVEEV